jgi:hypothetical protein
MGCLALANCVSDNVSGQVETDARYGHHRIVRYAERVPTQYVNDNTRATFVGGRPAGCPRSFCGCEASRYLFGEIRPQLNLASNWRRKFPQTSPAPGMAAVRNHHVFVLISPVDGSNWLVHDGNSGHRLTREHVRSIKGYTVVDPRGTVAITSAFPRTD